MITVNVQCFNTFGGILIFQQIIVHVDVFIYMHGIKQYIFDVMEATFHSQ